MNHAQTAFRAALIFFFFGFTHILVIAQPMAVAAERVLPSFCENVTDTAQILGCKKRELEYLQGELQSAYDRLAEKVAVDEAEQLRTVQQNWLSYRDTECAWEESWSQGEAIARVDELSCLVRLTKRRLARLDYYADDAIRALPQEHAIFPRWQNVLMAQGPHHFWNFNASQDISAVCEGLNGHITPGLMSTAIEPDGTVDDSRQANRIEAIIGITVTQATGRPSMDVLTLPTLADRCMSAFTLSRNIMIEDDLEIEDVSEENGAQAVAGNVQEETGAQCDFVVTFADSSCPTITIMRGNGVFMIGDEADRDNADDMPNDDLNN